MILMDSHHRQIDYLRLSITDMCNLRCLYCQPWKEGDKKIHREILRYEEIIRIASILVRLGIKKIRVTGGEPLIKRNVLHLLKELASIPELSELALTTNGIKLAQFAKQLKEVGVSRVNISLDSMDNERYAGITGGGDLDAVLRGIDEALSVGLVPLKINMVVMKGINDDEAQRFAQLTLDKPIIVRFIEFMPISQQGVEWDERYLPAHVLKQRLSSDFKIMECNGVHGNGPAIYYQIKGAVGSIGFISPISNHFCVSCNRLRLTPDGHLRLCLGQDTEVDLKMPMRQGATDEELQGIISQAVKDKPAGHQFQLDRPMGRQMSAIGG